MHRSTTSITTLWLGAAAACALFAAACFNPSLDNKLCGTAQSCPEGYECDVPSGVCVEQQPPSCPNPPCTAIAAEFAAVVPNDLDLLFVIDNSPETAEEQGALLDGFDRFLEHLSYAQDGLPNLHVGVVSTDLGVGNNSLATCDAEGDMGTLQNAPRGNCEPPNGQFIIDVANGQVGRTTNYAGDLGATFSCIARLGQGGCGFEQPLESMLRALDGSNPLNIGFLREDAYLAVVFVTNEDDCSTRNEAMFSPVETPELGPVSGFRCFEFGVECNPDTPRTTGIKQNCTPRADSPFMYDTTRYEDFLRTIKDDPNQVITAAFVGDSSLVSVEYDGSYYRVSSSCTSPLGDAQPPVRLTHFLSQFPQRNALANICSPDFSNALGSIGDLITGVIHQSQCVTVDIDLSAAIEGVQHQCEVVSIVGSSETTIPLCPAVPPQANALPCWHLQESRVCPAPMLSAVVVEWGNSRPALSTRIEARCVVD